MFKDCNEPPLEKDNGEFNNIQNFVILAEYVSYV